MRRKLDDNAMTLDAEEGVRSIAGRVREFVEEHVIPREASGFDEHGVRPDCRASLQDLAREAGLLTPQAPTPDGGRGLDMRGRAMVYEQAGRSVLGPQALNCAAPDEGNMHLLAAVATDAQKELYLQPLIRGDVRSCFAMTEPAPGAGSDPRMLRTAATRTQAGWRIDGRKWFITGAIGAEFGICLARTSDAIKGDRGATMFLVDMNQPGVRVVRAIATTDRSATGGHAEVVFDNCEVDESAVLGEVDLGFRYAQTRLEPARLTHCMRWLGLAQRAHEMATDRVAEREAFGQRLGELGMVQAMLADSEIDLRASRLLIWQACSELDNGGSAKQASSVAKVFVAEAVNRVIDRSVQMHGAIGVSGETELGSFLGEVRPFRIYDGSSETHRWAIARRLVGRAKR